MIEKISQSFIKDLRSYFAEEECGNIIREKYINDRFFSEEEPGQMELGAYFEYLLTLKLTGNGSIPKDGRIPKPQYMKSELKAKRNLKTGGNENLTDEQIAEKYSFGKDEMYDDYRKVYSNVELVINYFDLMGLKTIEAGVKKTNGRHEGTIDLIVECTKEVKFTNGIVWKVGDRFVIDLKYSGLVAKSTNYNKHGWNLVDKDDFKASGLQKEYHGTQAKEYHYLTGLPFYFWVTQSNNDKSNAAMVELFYVPVDEQMVKDHLEEGNALMRKFKTTAEFGFVARPSLEKCLYCPLRNECDDKQTFPHPKIVNL